MTFNPNADVSGHKARRSGGKTAAIAGSGVVGLGAIAVLLINLLSGGEVDLSALLGGGTGQDPTASSTEDVLLKDCDTGQEANERDDCRLAAGSVAIDQFWADGRVEGYVRPDLTIVDGQTSTPCGTASNAVGPFYCPADQGVYVDPTFFQLMRDQFGATAGELAQLYVLAHEYGHHVQNLDGTMAQYPNNGTGPESNGVRMELQADCYAGAWVGGMSQEKDSDGVPYLNPPTESEIEDALNAAATVGDDHIQKQAGGVSNPESWTHGSSEQREYWFANGFQNGYRSCDTFSVSGDEL